jgi:hypothetical protein
MSLIRRGRLSQKGHARTGSDLNLPPLSLTTSRRQLLQGVAGAGIVSLLVPTIGWTDAAAQAATASNDSAVPWTFWVSTFDGKTLLLTGLDAGGKVIASGLHVPPITQRSPDGSTLISLDITGASSSAVHRLVLRSAKDGTVLGQLLGQTGVVSIGDTVVGHELTLEISADGSYAAVLDTAWSASGQRHVSKRTLNPNPTPAQEIVVNDMSSATSIEVFRLAPAAPIGHQFLAADVLALSCGFAAHSVLVSWTEPGRDQTVKLMSQSARLMGTAPLEPVHSAGMTPAVGLGLSHSGLWAQSVGFRAVQFVNSGLKASQANMFPADWGAAKPYPTRLISIDDTDLLVVNGGIPAAAIWDGRDARLVSSELLANQPGDPRSSMGQWTVDATKTHLYVADSSPRQGGVWVYDLPSLSLVDRWLSSTAFSALKCSADGSTIFALARDRPLVFSITPEGKTVAATELPQRPSGILG